MKKILLGLLAIIILAVLAILFFLRSDSKNPYATTEWGRFSGTCETEKAPDANFGKDFHGCDYSVPKEEIPVFERAQINWNNQFDNSKSLPLMGSAMIDVDNDGIDEVFLAEPISGNDLELSN